MGSRSSARATSSKVDDGSGNKETEKGTNLIVATMANRSAQNFNRGRTLTPKVAKGKAKDGALEEPDMTSEEKLQFDEMREEEILKVAAEKKARALAIRERQEK